MTITVKDEILKVLRAMDDIVEQIGENFVYQQNHEDFMRSSCSYVRNDRPDCLIARVIFTLGVTMETLNEMEGRGPIKTFSPTGSRPRSDLGIVHQETFDVLQTAQTSQDHGGTWGVAAWRAYQHAVKILFNNNNNNEG